MIEFRALGALAVVVDGEEVAIGGPRQRRLLAMLLIHHDDVVSADRLADAVFDGEPTDAARTTLRSYIARTRRVIGAASSGSGLITQAPGYSLRISPGSFDAVCFEQRAAEGRRQLATGDPALAAVTLHAALEMWAGPAYAEFADEQWAQPEAQRLEELRLAALERLVEAELECGRAADTIPTLDTLVKDHPLREAFRAQQMLALYRAGRQVDALRAFRTYRETLIEEIGLEPSPALVDLQRRILDHDPGLELAEAAGEPLRGYRLGRRLGAGPNGTMYVATVAGVNHERTISILAEPRVDDPEFVRSFEANAQTIASLTHEAIVPLHDYWRQPGTAYIVTQRSATTLRDRLDRAPLDRDTILDIAVRIGGALLEASARGLEHGWITLDNIVGDDGQFAIGNFVVCPRNSGHDVADFAATLKACVQRTEPRITGTVGDDLSSILDHPGDDLAAFVESFTTTLMTDGEAVHLPAANPFKGLRAFDETDGDDFYGRAVLVEELLHRIAMTCPGPGLTLVVGGSGSGKSSVVRAGVIPQVRRGALRASGDWFVSMMLPGSDPFTELAEAIRRISVREHANLTSDLRDGRLSLADAIGDALPSGVRLLLVIDQFEELFTLTSDPEQADFLALLADAITDGGRVHVMATLRADFYDRPLESQRFGTLVGPATVVVPAMSPQELEAAIVRPVESCDATAEPALVAELIAAMNDQAAGLPALQFTLYELAEQRPDRCLTLDDYHALGGIERAIASRAEALFRSLDEPGRAVVRAVFEELVVIDVEAEPTGRRCARADLTAGADVDAVQQMIERWTAARLLSGDHDPRTRIPTVQVAHEALLRSWPRLREWIIEDRDLIIEAHRRREAAAEWIRVDRDEGALYRGARLEAALELASGIFDRLPPVEQAFLTASTTLRDREALEAQQHADRQQRANRRLRIQMGIIAAALVVALVVGFLAIDQRGEARSERDAADTARRDATARELASAAEANVDVDAERAIHLALLAVDTTRSVDGTALPEAINALHHAVTTARVLVNIPGVGGRLDWHPTEELFVTEGPEESGMIDIRSTRTGKTVRSWRGDAIDVNDAKYSDDGTMLAVAGDDGVLKVFDPTNGELISAVEGSGPVWDPTFDHSGSVLLAQWPDEQQIRLVDPHTGDVLGAVEGGVQYLEISPDGTAVAVANFQDEDGVTVLELGTQTPLVTMPAETWVQALRWSPDGSMIAAVADDGIVRVFDATTGQLLAAAAGHTGMGNSIEWSHDGRMLASGGMDGAALIWDFDGRMLVERQRIRLQDLSNGVPGLAFSPEGDRLAVADWQITSTKIIDITDRGGAEIRNVEAEPWLGVDLHGDALTVTAVGDRRLETHDLTSGDTDRRYGDDPLDWPGSVVDNAGEQIAIVIENRQAIEVRSVRSGKLLREVDVSDGSKAEAMAWSPDGRHLAVSGMINDFSTGVVVVTDPAGRVEARLEMDGIFIRSISFSADGTRLAIAKTNQVRADPERDGIRIWDWNKDEIVGEIVIQPMYVEYDPSGRFLGATVVNEASAQIFDAITLEPVATLAGSTTPMVPITFAPDGSTVATGGNDGSVRIWDSATGAELSVLTTPATVRRLDFDETGDRLVSTDDTNTARVWSLDLDTLVDIARQRVTRNLTRAECERFLQATCPR